MTESQIELGLSDGETERPKVVVVGAGWAGLGSAYHLAKAGYEVTLLKREAIREDWSPGGKPKADAL